MASRPPSQIFFAKPAPQLSTAECALLAGLVQYPTGYNPLADPQTAKNRQLTVLRLMQEAGYLDPATSAQVAAEPLAYRSHLFDVKAPHFVMYVQSLLAEQLGPERLRDGGLRVTTTLDVDLQREAEDAVRRRLAALTCRDESACKDAAGRDRRVDNAAAVIIDSQTGAILAMVGSPDYFNQGIAGNVNAALSLRQPGSAIKPFTYAAALDPNWSGKAGQPPLTAASILPDLPTTFYVENVDGQMAAYRPQNYDRIYHGPVSVRTALANSYNIPAVKVLDRVGVDTLRELASQAGIRSFTGRYGLALTLGGGDVRLLELTAAYGIFDDGRTLPTQAILSIKDADGEDPDDTESHKQLSCYGYPLTLSGHPSDLPPIRLPDHRHPLRRRRAAARLWAQLDPEPALPRRRQDRDDHRLARQLDGRLFDTPARGRMGGQCRQQPDGGRQRRRRRRSHLARPDAAGAHRAAAGLYAPRQDRRNRDLRGQRHAAGAGVPAHALGALPCRHAAYAARQPVPAPGDRPGHRPARPRTPRRPTAAASASTGCCRPSTTTG